MSNELVPKQGEPSKVISGTLIKETGILFGACVLAIAVLEGGAYLVFHIPPGQIVNEATAMLSMSINSSVAIYQASVSGPVELLAAGSVGGTVYTSVKVIKKQFRSRDRATH